MIRIDSVRWKRRVARELAKDQARLDAKYRGWSDRAIRVDAVYGPKFFQCPHCLAVRAQGQLPIQGWGEACRLELPPCRMLAVEGSKHE